METTKKTPFPFTPEDLKAILNTALSRGGNFSEIFLEYKQFHSVLMEEDIIRETSENIHVGAGIRVLCKDQTGYGYTNVLSLDRLERAAVIAASIAKGAPTFDSSPIRPVSFPHNFYLLILCMKMTFIK